MRLCIIDPFAGFIGPAQFCRDLFSSPMVDGTHVLILRTEAGGYDSFLQLNGCRIQIVRHTGAIPSMRDWIGWLRCPHDATIAVTEIIKVIREFKPTLILSNSELNPLAGALACMFGVPAIARVHAQTVGGHGQLGRLYVRGLDRAFDALLCSSHSTASYLAHLGLPESKLMVLENAVDEKTFYPSPATPHGRSELRSEER